MNSSIPNILYTALLNELAEIDRQNMPAGKKLAAITKSVRSSVEQLKTEVIAEDFEDRQQEINFFKYEKPRFTSEQLYAMEIFNMESNRPVTEGPEQAFFYSQELQFIKRFFEQNRFLYQYYQLDAGDMDHLFFVRGARPADVLLPEVHDFDPTFATAGDYLFAKFMAFEKVQEYVIDHLYGDKDNPSRPKHGEKGKALTWTGTKTELVELAYGIYRTGRVNSSTAEIAEVINWLEKSFSIDLGRYYQTFSEIKARKSSKSAFLDQMKEGLVKYISDGDAFNPRGRG